ncbi:unnamed protein product [Caenorhabditis bovis]|uniref:Caspase family p20 domain-containing protein n=1 Tax=Caenorhabditis bovis TaxID=2654633 RepID=A0A8S1EN94_9PELO|nr:unnamed protein product [Caenorhabditis bovis]
MVTLETNVADLPVNTFRQLASSLNKNDIWLKLVEDGSCPMFALSADEIDRLYRSDNPGESLIRRWGNRGQTVKDLLSRLQQLAKCYGDDFDTPQLVLNRKFKDLRWGRDEHVMVAIDDNLLRLECKAVGFPTPHIRWYSSSDMSNPVGTGKILELTRCKCSSEHVYKCVATNEVPVGFAFSEFYRKPGKMYTSTLESRLIDVTSFIRDDELCESCRARELDKFIKIVDDSDDEAKSRIRTGTSSDHLIASDKVALIISNSSYEYLPELVTPHCDAQMLAEALQKMDYKTVALADLSLDEMRYFIREYRKLLGDGVYAVFYFVGHGFEVNGQCHLLGVDAPEDAHKPQHALSMDWVLSVFRDIDPALNLLLLDVCRRFIPFECIPAFVQYSEQFKKYHRAHRNMVYGYSTSGGIGAYEIKGEVNGVFMKYLKEHVKLQIPVIDMLNKVLNDIAKDKKVCDVQIPEIRTTLSQPRSLADPLRCDGHTISYDNHSIHWRLMHELPDPVNVKFDDEQLSVTIWFQFCGNFTNKVYVLSSVEDLRDSHGDDDNYEVSAKALEHRAYLSFQEEITASPAKEYADDMEGVSLYWILSGLQRIKGGGELRCHVELKSIKRADREEELAEEVDEDEEDEEQLQLVAEKSVDIGHVLITRINCL